MHIFYVPNIDNEFCCLSEEESKHCVKVLRLSKGDNVVLIDGIGGYYEAEIFEPHPKHCQLKIIQKTNDYGKREYSIHIAIAPTKNIDRIEWFIEKAVEIGVDELTPIICQHSERKNINIDRLEKIILSAMKQSMKAYKPRLNNAITFSEFIKKEHNGCKFIAHCSDTEKISLKSAVTTENHYTILIGPEGDFSPEEINMAMNNNFKCVHLGPSRLRTETAGVVACHTINLLKQN